ncbi:hypothetical protein MUK42_11754 [Musa troglodytarum]|uniref:Uncharacterized protein n=1 Tax=Musa troglodytarum TaxID=320322 RepID=A0A9E7GKL3_9LILI|nr:hypothetical protein MUK42_11754 [Musa troglodytarum]
MISLCIATNLKALFHGRSGILSDTVDFFCMITNSPEVYHLRLETS